MRTTSPDSSTAAQTDPSPKATPVGVPSTAMVTSSAPSPPPISTTIHRHRDRSGHEPAPTSQVDRRSPSPDGRLGRCRFGRWRGSGVPQDRRHRHRPGRHRLRGGRRAVIPTWLITRGPLVWWSHRFAPIATTALGSSNVSGGRPSSILQEAGHERGATGATGDVGGAEVRERQPRPFDGGGELVEGVAQFGLDERLQLGPGDPDVAAHRCAEHHARRGLPRQGFFRLAYGDGQLGVGVAPKRVVGVA